MRVVSGAKLRYLTPLIKWRLMDLNSLREEGNYPGTSSGFRKFILNLERKGLLTSFEDHFWQRKIVCLTKEGEKQIGAGEKLPSISEDSFSHDSRLSLLGRCFQNLESVEEVILEHELLDGRRVGEVNSHVPDGIIKGSKRKGKFRIALELELSRKSQKRYLSKIEDYLKSSAYSHALYFFNSEGVHKSYLSTIKDKFGVEAFEKIMLATNPLIFDPAFNFDETKVFFKGKEVNIHELF